jgi:hypothetical protein
MIQIFQSRKEQALEAVRSTASKPQLAMQCQAPNQGVSLVQQIVR